jgi:Beta-lactamase class C and other penicillin binding proteins
MQNREKEKNNSFTPLMMRSTSATSDTPGGSLPGDPPIDTTELQKILDDARQPTESKSISVSIILSNGSEMNVVSNRVGDPDAVTTDMHFSIGSATKMFVAASIFKLIEEKKLTFDDTLQDLLYNTDIPDTKHKLDSQFISRIDPHIRIKDLLNHTTGIDDFLGSDYYYDLVMDLDAKWDPAKTISYVTSPSYTYDYANPENNSFFYSNTDYIILGMIIENITGKKIYSVINDYFLTPLKMDNTFMAGVDPYWGLTSIPGPNAVGFEENLDGSWTKSSDVQIFNLRMIDENAIPLYSSTWTSGNMISTAREMARWVKYFYHYQLDSGYINDEALITGYLLSLDFTEKKYGYGIEYFKHTSNCELWGHTGTILGFRSLIFYLPKKDISLALLFNGHRIDRWEILDIVVDYINANL